jgi:hypothetical protein
MPRNNNEHKMGTGAKAGLGLAALAATAAGLYYFYGSKEGAKHRKALKGWAVKARGEVMERMEKLKSIDRETYNKIVDQVIGRYRGMKNISVAELMALASELKGYWNNIMKDMGKSENGSTKKPSAPRRRKTRAKASSAK